MQNPSPCRQTYSESYIEGPYLSNGLSDLKQNGAKEENKMFGSIVYALSRDVVNFVLIDIKLFLIDKLKLFVGYCRTPTSLQGHEESSQKMVICIVPFRLMSLVPLERCEG